MRGWNSGRFRDGSNWGGEAAPLLLVALPSSSGQGRAFPPFCPGWCGLNLEDFTLLGLLPRVKSPRPVILGEMGVRSRDTHLFLHSQQAQQCGSSGLYIMEGSSTPGQPCPLDFPLIHWLHAPPSHSSCSWMQASALLCVRFPASCEILLLLSSLREVPVPGFVSIGSEAPH